MSDRTDIALISNPSLAVAKSSEEAQENGEKRSRS